MLVSNCWLANLKPNLHARVRLFCFPYAGGSAALYRTWFAGLPASVEVCPVELPGRGVRLKEPPFAQLLPLVDAAAEALRPYLDRPFALFGHSMGALIAYQLACWLHAEYDLRTSHLFVSAHRAPQIPYTNRPTYSLPDPELLEKLRELNGTPREVLDQPELMELLLPILRADFEIDETYLHVPQPALDCPITVFGGLQDPSVSRDGLEAWREQTRAAFTLRMLPGDHFFLSSARPVLLGVLAHELQQIVRGVVA